MRITILTYGTRGEVQPYIALGMGLQEAGHTVRIAAHDIFRDLIISRGLEFAPVAGDPREWMKLQGTREVMATRSLLKQLREGLKMLRSSLESSMADCLKACEDTDAIIYSAFAWSGYSIAEKLQIPSCQAFVYPLNPTHEFPSPAFSTNFSLGRNYNWWTHIIAQWIATLPFHKQMNHLRKHLLGLPPLPAKGMYFLLKKQKIPFLFGYSTHFQPKPSDWTELMDVTGYWFLDRPHDWQPPADLAAFLEAGPPPVYIGFGSMCIPDPAKMTRIIVEALERTGQRCILLPGWGGLSVDNLPSSVFVVHDVPFDWLFPRVAAVVHHAGSGSTAASLRAGIPVVAIPFLADQFFFARRVEELNVGPRSIPQTKLTADNLTTALQVALHNTQIRQAAKKLGQQIRSEDGVGKAVTLLELRFANERKANEVEVLS